MNGVGMQFYIGGALSVSIEKGALEKALAGGCLELTDPRLQTGSECWQCRKNGDPERHQL